MAAVLDRRFDNANYPVGGMNSSPNQTIVTDTYGGWLTRAQRAVIFGLVGMALTLGTFLPAIVMLGMNWTDSPTEGIRGACTNELAVRSLTTACFFIFHAMLVIPMFIIGDRAQSVSTYNNGLASFWTTRLAHTAAVLQAVGNIIEIALLIWTSVAFWNNGLADSASGCNNYPQYRTYMWAMLIIGFALAAISLVTVHWQYTSAAIRYRMGGYSKHGVSSGAAP